MIFKREQNTLNVNALCATSRPGQNNSSYSSYLLNCLPNARTDNNNGWNYNDKTMKTHKKRQNFELKSIDKRQTTQLKSHMCHCPCQTLFIQSKAAACPRDDAHRCRTYKYHWALHFCAKLERKDMTEMTTNRKCVDRTRWSNKMWSAVSHCIKIDKVLTNGVIHDSIQ